jgi:lipopolysaccharide biosynthesis protein
MDREIGQKREKNGVSAGNENKSSDQKTQRNFRGISNITYRETEANTGWYFYAFICIFRDNYVKNNSRINILR